LGRSYRAIARELGRSPHTIKRLLTKPAVAAEVSVKKIELADLYEQRAYEIVEAVTAEDISKASLQQMAVSSGIFLDKSRLLRGESTSNISMEVLMQVAIMVRDERDRADDSGGIPQQAALPAQVAAIPSTPIPTPAREPAARSNRPQGPAIPAVRYYSANPVDPPEDTDVLMRGLR
jgi:hypothetical protein